jgi:ABC-2 type transport system permease protein
VSNLGRAYGWEILKLVRQKRTWAGLIAAVLYAAAFVIALAVKKHAGIPPDVPLAKQVTRSGVVLPIALLTFATYFGAPVIASLVAGDIVSSEDANNTLKMILTRSTGRGTIYASKALAAATYGVALIVTLFVASVIGSEIAWGMHGVTLLDGTHASGGRGLGLDALAYLTYLMPLAVLVAFAFFLSTVTRNSAAAIVGTVIFALAFQGVAALPGMEGAKPYLLPMQFESWELLFGKGGESILRAAWTCAIYTAVPLAAGWAVFARRDIAGA